MSLTLTRRTLAARHPGHVPAASPPVGAASTGVPAVAAPIPTDDVNVVTPSPDADAAHDGVDPLDPEAGMATAEYAIATVAAAGFAGLLIAILRSAEVRELLLGIVRSALSV